jgi:hypothetical protein
LRALFASFAENDIVAVYPGKWSAYMLMLRVGLESCSRIRYIVDRDHDCLAGKLGIEVIEPEEVSARDIDFIVLARHNQAVPTVGYQLNGEIEELPVGENTEVIDIYEYLADNGVVCTTDFWDYEITDDDIEAGYMNV